MFAMAMSGSYCGKELKDSFQVSRVTFLLVLLSLYMFKAVCSSALFCGVLSQSSVNSMAVCCDCPPIC